MHETVYRGTLASWPRAPLQDEDFARGEITLVVAGAAAAGRAMTQLLARALPLLLKDLPPARAAAIGAQLSGVPRPRAYEQALQLARNNGCRTGLEAVSWALESRPGNRCFPRRGNGGKSGLGGSRCQVTPGGREPTESATESKPPKRRKALVRVKGCGKSAPRRW